VQARNISAGRKEGDVSTKMGMVVGFGAGYVLGARAGRERYEDIRRMWARVTGSPQVQRATQRTKELTGDRAKQGLYAVQRKVEKAGTAVKGRLNRDSTADIIGAETGDTDPWRGNPVPDTAEGPLP
jgi:hypothetical protein